MPNDELTARAPLMDALADVQMRQNTEADGHWTARISAGSFGLSFATVTSLEGGVHAEVSPIAVSNTDWKATPPCPDHEAAKARAIYEARAQLGMLLELLDRLEEGENDRKGL